MSQTKGMPQECVSERIFDKFVDIAASQIQERMVEGMQFMPHFYHAPTGLRVPLVHHFLTEHPEL